MANSDASTIAPFDLVLEQNDFHALLLPSEANSPPFSARNCPQAGNIVGEKRSTKSQFKPECLSKPLPSVPSLQICCPQAVLVEDVELDIPIIALKRSVRRHHEKPRTQLSTELAPCTHSQATAAATKSPFTTYTYQGQPLLNSEQLKNQVATARVTDQDFRIPHVSPIQARQEEISKQQGQDVNEKSREMSVPHGKAVTAHSSQHSMTQKSTARKRKRKESTYPIADVPNSKKKGCGAGLVLPPLSSIPFPFYPPMHYDLVTQGIMKMETVTFASPETDPLPPLRELVGTRFHLPTSSLHAARKAPRRSIRASARNSYDLRGNGDASLRDGMMHTKGLRKRQIPMTANSLIAQNKELAQENLRLRAELVLAYRNQFVSAAERTAPSFSSDQGESTQVVNLPKISTAIELCRLASTLSSLHFRELPRDVLRCTQSFERANPFILCAKQAFDFILAQMKSTDAGAEYCLKQSVSAVFKDVHLKILSTLVKPNDEESTKLFETVYSFVLSQIKHAYKSMLTEQDSIDVAWSRTISDVILKELQRTLQSLLPSANCIERLQQLLSEVLQIIANKLRENTGRITPRLLCSAVEVTTTIAMVFPQASSTLSKDDLLLIARYNPLFFRVGIQEFVSAGTSDRSA